MDHIETILVIKEALSLFEEATGMVTSYIKYTLTPYELSEYELQYIQIIFPF